MKQSKMMGNTKYKVGDKVRIKNFDWFRNEGANMVVTYMTKYYGEVVTIKSINNGFYRIKEDGGQYCWIDEMFECKVDEKIKPKFKVGDKVKDKNNRVWFIVRVSETFFDISSIPNGTDGSEVSGYFVPMEDQDDYELISNDMENMRFKVGDKITNGKTTLTILTLTPDRYLVKDNFGECGILYFNSQDGWKIVEEETKPKYEDEVNGEYYSTPKYLVRPSGYQFIDENGNVINAQKIVLEKKTVEEKYSDVKIQIFGNVVILKGGINADNPTEYMNEVVHYIVKLLGNPKHNQFIEEFLDNPWVRILVFDFNSMEFNNSFDDIVTKFKKE